MGKRAWFRVYVERLLMEQFDTTSLVKDGDGDVPFSKGTSACFVTVEDRPLGVRVWGMAATGIRPTAAVLREVNELNQRPATRRSCMPATGCGSSSGSRPTRSRRAR